MAGDTQMMSEMALSSIPLQRRDAAFQGNWCINQYAHGVLYAVIETHVKHCGKGVREGNATGGN